MLLLKPITVYFQRTWVESTRHILLLTPTWSQSLKTDIGQIFENNFCQSVQKHGREGEKEEKTRKGNCKALCVTRKRENQ